MVAIINFDDIYQGDDWQKTILLQDADGSTLDLSGSSFRMQFRSPFSKKLYVTLRMGNGINFLNNLITLSLTHDQVRLFTMRTVIYDLELTWSNGSVVTLFKGVSKVIQDVTLPDSSDIPSADFSNSFNSGYVAILSLA